MVQVPWPRSDFTFGQPRGTAACTEPAPARPRRTGPPRGDGEAGIFQAWLFAASFLPWQHLLRGFFLLFLTVPYASVSKQWRLHTDWESSPSLPPSSLSPAKPERPRGWPRAPRSQGERSTIGTARWGREGCGAAPKLGEPVSEGLRCRAPSLNSGGSWSSRSRHSSSLLHGRSQSQARGGTQRLYYYNIIINNKPHVGSSGWSLGQLLKYKAQPCPTNPRLPMPLLPPQTKKCKIPWCKDPELAPLTVRTPFQRWQQSL